MSDDTSGKSAATASGQSADEGSKDIVVDRSPEDQAKRIVELSAENKKYRQKASATDQQLSDAMARLKALEEERAKEQGNWQKLFETEKARASELEQALKRDRANFAYRSVSSQFAAEAAKAGCAKVDDLLKLAAADGILNELEVSQEDFSVAPDSLKSALEKAQKAYPYLYARSTPAVRDGVPATNNTTVAKRDLTSMKMEDLIAMAKNATQ